MNDSRLVISLDFELIWGVFDKVDHINKVEYFLSTRESIPILLKLFNDYQIHTTWATVGMLFNKNWDDWMENIPRVKPEYFNQALSAYKYGFDNKDYINDKLCFANDLIQTISKTPFQEIGTHSYSHYYCLENGQTEESFREDLETAIRLASNLNVELKSLVFPRNQYNKDYLKICQELGIRTVRSNPDNWYWQNTQKDSLQTKIFRTGDAYFGTRDKSYPRNLVKKSEGIPVIQKASRLLRPKEGKLMDQLKLKRILSEITYAARNNQIYHLWWHPHNFGNDVEGNLDNLKTILDHFKYCQEKFSMKSSNMIEIANEIESTMS